MLKKIVKKAIKVGFMAMPSHLSIAICRMCHFLACCLPKDKEFIVSYLNKYWMYVSTIYGIEQSILTGDYEPDTLSIIREYVLPGGVAIDVGANVGAISIVLADQVGCSGKVYAIEPGTDTFNRLQRNIGLNPNLSMVISLHNLGCAEESGKLVYHELAHARGNAILGDLDTEWIAHKSQEVPVTTIDAFVANNAITRVDFMKIDVEQMEYNVLLGSQETLAKFHPIIYFETLPDPYMGRLGITGADNFRRIESLLKRLGYSIYRIDCGKHDTIATADNFLLNNIAVVL
jgi:FkbM family methyltransferase